MNVEPARSFIRLSPSDDRPSNANIQIRDMSAHYTQLPSQSTAQLPLYSSETPSSSSARASPSSPPPARTQRHDEKGLLGVDGTRLDTTDEEEEEEEELENEIKGSQSPRSWSDRLPVRTLLFSLDELVH